MPRAAMLAMLGVCFANCLGVASASGGGAVPCTQGQCENDADGGTPDAGVSSLDAGADAGISPTDGGADAGTAPEDAVPCCQLPCTQQGFIYSARCAIQFQGDCGTTPQKPMCFEINTSAVQLGMSPSTSLYVKFPIDRTIKNIDVIAARFDQRIETHVMMRESLVGIEAKYTEVLNQYHQLGYWGRFEDPVFPRTWADFGGETSSEQISFPVDAFVPMTDQMFLLLVNESTQASTFNMAVGVR